MAWFVVRYQQDKYNPKENNRMYVDLGDIIKFGRVNFKVSVIKSDKLKKSI